MGLDQYRVLGRASDEPRDSGEIPLAVERGIVSTLQGG